MKKIFGTFIVLTLTLCLVFLLSACVYNGSVFCNHTDTDENGKCDECGKNVEKKPENPDEPEVHTHTLTKISANSATCTENGNIEYYTCSGCEKIYSDANGNTEITIADTVINSAHTGGTEIRGATEATEDEEGYTGDTYCLGCNTLLSSGEAIDKLPHTHNMQKTEAVSATCTENGNIEYWTCTKCEKIYSDVNGNTEIDIADTVIPAAHEMNGNSCVNCDYQYTEGLEYTINSDNASYSVTGIGYATYTDIVIPSTYNNLPVTSIGDRAFLYCSSLTSVTIPDSVTSIGDSAFSRCPSLTSVTIPDSVASIGDWAFHYCTSLIRVTIPDSVTEIGYDAFAHCDSLTSVTVGKSVTSIGNSAFSYCTSLTSIIVDENNTAYKSIDGNLYTKDGKTLIQYATGKTDESFSIPAEVDTVGDEAFSGCTSLTDITIPDSVTSIGYGAFRDCTSLTDITIPDSVASIGDYAFEYCTSLTSVTIPDSVTSIGFGAFSYCTSLDSVTIGNSVTSIGNFAFSDCTSLTSVTIGNSVTNIGNSAFSGCTSLTDIAIPDSVTSIGYGVFSYCTSLTSIIVDENNTAYKSIDGNLYTKDGKTLIQYATGKTDESFSIPAEVDTVGDEAFYGCTSLTSVTIGNSVTSIGECAFSDCTSLTSVTIPDSITSIGEQAFRDCTSLTSVTIPDSVTSIGDRAFSDCTSLTSVTIPDSVTSIGYAAFFNCDSLTSITIPDSITSIGDDAFFSCDSLTSITIPDSITSIGDDAFSGCDSLTSIIVDENNTAYKSIDGNLYTKDGKTLIQYATGKKDESFSIPAEVDTVGDYAFYGCTSLTSITIPDSITSIGEWAFSLCTSLTSINYRGTEDGWNAISKGLHWNYGSGAYTITYNYTED